MSNRNIKIKKQINNNILNKFDNLQYMQNLRENIEHYDENLIEEFIDSIRFYILFNETTILENKFIVFWLDFLIQNYIEKFNTILTKKINDIIITLDLYPLLSETSKKLNNITVNLIDEISIKLRSKNKKILSDTQYFFRSKILERKNIIFSAPTSFGKSTIVIDAIKELINQGKVNKILFILPTKALINEYRRKIKLSIENIPIIENPYIEDEFEKVIYLFTPERFIVYYENNKQSKIDYVINDEAQMLINIDKKKCVDRSILLAKTLSILANNNVPIIFLMPYVYKPYESFIYKYINTDNNEIIEVSDEVVPFVSNNYYMLDVNGKDLFRYDFSKDSGISYANSKFITKTSENFDKNNVSDWSMLIVDNIKKIINIEKKFIIFCTNKDEIKFIAKRMVENKTVKPEQINYRMQALINYIEQNISPEFELIDFLKNGIAIHFSEVDSYIRRQLEIIFNEETDIKGMICTSTLLQGVNLNAQNLIMIYRSKFSTVGNVEIDYRNLIGRTARLGINIQGNIFNISCCKNLEKEGERLYKSSNPVKINIDKAIEKLKAEKNDIAETYAVDANVNTQLKKDLNAGEEQIVKNLDYFIGCRKAKNVEEKIKEEKLEYYVDLLKNIGNYEKTYELIKELAYIYDWENSINKDIKFRMTNIEYITKLAIGVFNGDSVLKIIEKSINFVKQNDEYKLVVCKDHKNAEYVKMIRAVNYNSESMREFIRHTDINTYIYTVLYDIQKLIEYQLKKFIQDFYFRIKNMNNSVIKEVEEILDYSTKDKKKIKLNNIGIVDTFAINMLTQSEFSVFFDKNNNVNIEKLKIYANELSANDPLKYAILDTI